MDAATRFSEQAGAKNPQNTEALLFKADLLQAQGQIDASLATYDQVLKLKPDNFSAHINKASIEVATGKLDAAQADIDAARKAMPKNLNVFYYQALLDYRKGKFSASLESLQSILRAVPDHMPSVLLAGAVQYALGSMPQAQQHLKKYLAENPDNLYARRLMIATLLKTRQTEVALAQLQPLLKEQGQQDASVLALAGEAYMQAKDFNKATEYFEKVNAITPKNPKLHTALAMSRMAQGDQAHAIDELETAAKLDTQSTQPDVLLIMNYLRRHETDKAMAAANNLEKEQPNNPIAHNMKGAVYLAKKDMVSARASFEKALSLQPTYFPALMNLVQLDLQDKNPTAARKRLEGFLEKDKGNLRAMVELARLAISQGQKQEAESWLQRASQEHPESVQPSQLLVGFYLQAGEKKKALDLARKIQASNPQSPELLALLAQAYLADGNNEKALDAYAQQAVLMPESASVQYRIAIVHMAMQNTQGATDALNKALALQPDYLEAKLALATLEARKGNREEALKMAQNIQKQHGKSPAGYILEGDLYMGDKKPALAAKAYEQGMNIGKSAPLLIKLHTALIQDGKGKEAESRLLQWLKEQPTDVPVRIYLADTYLRAKERKLAIEQYETILQQQPKNVLALNNLASLYQQEKDPRALEVAERAYQLMPDNAAVQDTLGWILVEQGNTARGLPLLQKAASLAPESAEIRYHLILGLVKSGDKAKARKELEQLLSTGKTFSRTEEAKALLKQL
jgi:putative PEP-CTERM system TPR-repeat lipoprotein